MKLKLSKYQSGVSLVEVVLVIAAIGFLALLMVNIPPAINSINKSKHSSVARDIANKQVDHLRSLGYVNLANGESNFSDSKLSSIPNSEGVYEILDCPQSICLNSEEIKEIKVTVNWKEGTEDKSVILTTLVGNGGLGQ